MPKESIKDKLEGKELDLSLSSLTTVPVKEIAALPKATHLDLSCNQITVLPDNFCILTHLVKLDISKNGLTKLPDDIGSLTKLQHLDVFSNNLQMLPISFWQLKSLKWLDLKDNPLDETLKGIAGDCLDDMQCRKCAKQVLLYMKTLQSEHERQRQKRLQQERELEALKKAEEEKEKQRKKAEKLKEKEQRRLKYQAEQLEKKKQQETSADPEADVENLKKSKISENGIKRVHQETRQNVGLSCWGVLLTALIGLLAILVGLYFYCEGHMKDPLCIKGHSTFNHYYASVTQMIKKYTET